VKKETKNTVIAMAAVAVMFTAVYACIILYAGTTTPFYTVESGSMRHSDKSQTGVIDTGDMVIGRDPSKVDITTYADGLANGYRKFGDYGDVILYSAPNGRTIIHRAVLAAEYKGGGVWSIPSLENLEWSCTGGGNPDALNGGSLTLRNFGFDGRTVTVNLTGLTAGLSGGERGYITVGDANGSGDPVLVTDAMIVAVAAWEIPWLGCIKLYITGNNTDQIPFNSVVALIVTALAVILLAAAAGVVYDKITKQKE
jgi:signal peptidase